MDAFTIRRRLQEAYDRQAAERDQFAKDAWKVDERDRFLSHLLEGRVRTLLEVGAGTGQDSVFFQTHGVQVTAVDLSSEMVQACRRKGLDAHQMDCGHLAFPDESFDAVWSMNCLLHVPKGDLSSVLNGIRRVMRDGGVFYLGVYGGVDLEGIWEEDHYAPPRYFSFHTDASIQQALERHFRVVSLRSVDYGHPVLHFQSLILQKTP